jgi:signal transduction histidine kinase
MVSLRSNQIGLRARLTLLATGVVAVTLAVAAALLLAVVRHSVLRSLDDSARQQAKDVAALARSGRLPDPIPVGAGTAGVQIVDAQDRVVAVSAGADRLTALLDAPGVAAVRSGSVRVISGARLGTPDSLRIVGFSIAPASGAEGGQTVLVAVSQAEATGSVRALSVATAIGGPVLLATFALVCWLLVGRSLQPVSRLRAGAEDIAAAGSTAGRRLPVPLPQDEIRRLAETLNGMLDRLESAIAAQRAFVADAAHELRSPLAAVRTQLEVARRHPETQSWDETAEGVLAETDRLARLVDDLLVLARVDDRARAARSDGSPDDGSDDGWPDRADAVTSAVDVGAIAGQVAGQPWRVPVSVGPEPERDGAPPAAPGALSRRLMVPGPADLVTRILVNLVDNATRHARSRVVIDLAAERGHIVVSVADDGPGVPAGDRQRVFERFTRLDEGRSRDQGGSGLGLAIVRRLVTATGGQVWLEDGPGGDGTRAVVTWPAK